MNDSRLLQALLPLIAVQLLLIVTALISLAKADKVAGGRKWVWAIVIVIFQMVGPIAYFVFGRKGDR